MPLKYMLQYFKGMTKIIASKNFSHVLFMRTGAVAMLVVTA